MAKVVYIAAFVEDDVEDPIDAVSEWLNNIPEEFAGPQYGIPGMVISGIELTNEMLQAYVEGMNDSQYENEIHPRHGVS